MEAIGPAGQVNHLMLLYIYPTHVLIHLTQLLGCYCPQARRERRREMR